MRIRFGIKVRCFKNVCKVAVLKRIKFLPKPVFETIYYKTIIPSVLYDIVAKYEKECKP